MTACPNCGYAHADRDYAPELVDIPMQNKQKDVVLRLQQARGAYVTKDSLLHFLYGDREDGGPDSAERTFCVHICRARKSIAHTGWIIDWHRYRGYRLVKMGYDLCKGSTS